MSVITRLIEHWACRVVLGPDPHFAIEEMGCRGVTRPLLTLLPFFLVFFTWLITRQRSREGRYLAYLALRSTPENITTPEAVPAPGQVPGQAPCRGSHGCFLWPGQVLGAGLASLPRAFSPFTCKRQNSNTKEPATASVPQSCQLVANVLLLSLGNACV